MTVGDVPEQRAGGSSREGPRPVSRRHHLRVSRDLVIWLLVLAYLFVLLVFEVIRQA